MTDASELYQSLILDHNRAPRNFRVLEHADRRPHGRSAIGVKQIGGHLIAEATAPDGLVEALRLDSEDTFLLALQWHPEWKVTDNPFYLEIFKAFGAACKARSESRKR